MKLACLITLIAAGTVIADAQTALGQPDPDEGIVRHGWSTTLNFEVTSPGGSAGAWSTGAGGSVSVAYTYMLTHNWFIVPEISGFYNSMGSNFILQEDHIYEGSVRNAGLRVPVMAGYTFNITPDLRFAASTGPMLNISLYARELASPDFTPEGAEVPKAVNLFNQGFKHVDLQWGLYAGVTYQSHYSVGIGYSIGLTPMADLTIADTVHHVRRNNFSITLGYTF